MFFGQMSLKLNYLDTRTEDMFGVTATVLWVYFVLFSFTRSGDSRMLLLLVSVLIAHLKLLAT